MLAELFAQAGADDYDYEAVFALCRCCRDQDVPGLIDLLATAPTRHLEMLTRTVAGLAWTDQRDELMTLLHNGQRQRADSAAYILARKPDQIPATVLIEGFDDQSSRTRRLYCFLLGKVAEPDAAVQAALIKALDDENAGIRWQAAVSIGWLELNNETTVAALIEDIDDNYSIVTGAVVMVLRAFDANEAAPAMLHCLQNVPPRWRDRQDQFEAIHGEAGYHNGLTEDLRVMVLRTGDGIAEAIWATSALCGALGHFEYAPAKETLLGMLHRSRCGPVLEALKNIDPDGHVNRLVDVVTNAGGYEQSSYDRELALVELARVGNADIVPHLLPLLDDTDHLGHSYNGREWRLCDQAASTISTLLGWPERLTYRSQMAPREELIAKIRQWVADAGQVETGEPVEGE